jgi:coenzyme F420-0:L-glutamate ligase
MTTAPDRLEVWAWSWPEVTAGDDLAALIAESAAQTPLADGDIVIVTSKVVSKAEGARHIGDKSAVVAAETVRVVARRGLMTIAQTRHGLVLAGAGVDASNVSGDEVLSLPADSDATARRLRAEIAHRLEVNAAVIVTDTAGRAWRVGQTDIAIGAAGIDPLLDLRGRPDADGRLLTVTTPAVGDEIASLGDLVKGKATGRPAAVVRGLAPLVLPTGSDGPGAVALVREAQSDLFGLGAREAARVAALRDDETALASFPARAEDDPDPFDGLGSTRGDVSALVSSDEAGTAWSVTVCVRDGAGEDALVEAGRLIERAAALAAAHRLSAAPPAHTPSPPTSWRSLHGATWVLA